MREILLLNFRCFDIQKIEFKQGINLLIGDNASGKTTILKACKYVLSSFFAGYYYGYKLDYRIVLNYQTSSLYFHTYQHNS